MKPFKSLFLIAAPLLSLARPLLFHSQAFTGPQLSTRDLIGSLTAVHPWARDELERDETFARRSGSPSEAATVNSAPPSPVEPPTLTPKEMEKFDTAGAEQRQKQAASKLGKLFGADVTINTATPGSFNAIPNDNARRPGKFKSLLFGRKRAPKPVPELPAPDGESSAPEQLPTESPSPAGALKTKKSTLSIGRQKISNAILEPVPKLPKPPAADGETSALLTPENSAGRSVERQKSWWKKKQ